MTVQELIDELKSYPKDMMVVIDTYEGGLYELGELEPIKVSLNPKTKRSYGSYSHCRKGGIPALWLDK
ncbi:MAG: hypothetical protein MJH10_18015 [Epibacterium sp.]|nr:hypothetical protein [Epibacterium sp.]NQX75389.1 hypothetical protein [Epibacterium sp.]